MVLDVTHHKIQRKTTGSEESLKHHALEITSPDVWLMNTNQMIRDGRCYFSLNAPSKNHGSLRTTNLIATVAVRGGIALSDDRALSSKVSISTEQTGFVSR